MAIAWILAEAAAFWNTARLVVPAQKSITRQQALLAAVLTFVGVGIKATVLACFGLYSLAALTCLTAGEVLVSVLLCRKNVSVWKGFPALFRAPFPRGMIVILLAAAVLYFCFPTTYLSGGRDPGLYLINAVHISETGAFQYVPDAYMAEHYAELAGVARLDYPALYSAFEYGISSDPGQVVPQFLPVLPSMLAVGYDLAGIAGAIRVNGITGLLCLAALYALVRPMYGPRVAVLAAALMLVNPAQLWGARITQTELLCQLLLFAALRVLADGWEARRPAAAWLAGFLLGWGTFVRIDTYLLGAGFLLFYLYELLCRRPHAAWLGRTVGMYALFCAASLVYGWTCSYPYFYDHWQAGVLAQVVLFNAGLLALILLLALVWRLCPRAVLPDVYRQAAANQKVMRIFCLALGALFLLAFAVRPLLAPDDFNHRAAFEFCYYTSVLAIPLALWGLYRTFWQQADRRERFLPFFFIGGSNLFVYLWRPSISADHIWASRRWVTAAIPFVLVLAAYGISRLRLARWPRYRRWAQGGCVLVIGAYLLWQCRGFLLTPMWSGIAGDYQVVAETLDDETLYLTTNTETASVFHVVCHKNVRLLEDDPVALKEYLQDNGSLNYLGDSRDLDLLEVQCELLGEGSVGGKMLEETYGHVPGRWIDRTYTCNRYLVTLRSLDTPQPIELTRFFTTPEVAELVEGVGIVGTGAEGHLLYGPYCTLLPGEYEVVFTLTGDPDAPLTLEAVAGNQQMLDTVTATGAQELRLHFSIDEPTAEIEFRLHLDAPARVTCTGVTVQKLAEN